MNHILKILLTGLFFISCFYKGQCYKVLKAESEVSFGGREESRRQIFHLSLKNNPKLEAKYLFVGSEKLEIAKTISNNTIDIKAEYYPLKENSLQIDPKTSNTVKKNNNYNPEIFFLVSENVKNKKIVKQKIKVTNSHKASDNQLPLESPFQ